MIKTTKKQTEQASEYIRNLITSGEVSTDGKIPAVRKLADQTGFQRNTIWRALLQLKQERYVVSAPNGRYQVHPRFKLNRKGSKKLSIAFVGAGMNTLESPYIQMVYNSLEGNQTGFNIKIQLFLEIGEKEVKYAELNKFDAVILGTGLAFEKYKNLRKKGIYATGIAAPYYFKLPSNVMIDNFNGGETAGNILTNSKIRKAVLLGESSKFPDAWHEDFELRVLGFRKRWLQSGKSSDDITEYPLHVETDLREKDIEKIVSHHTGFTGYFALSDPTGILLLKALKKQGIKVPKDATVLGFDDNPEAKKADLSTLHPDPDEMAEKLILQLRTQESEPDYSETIHVKPCFTKRKTTA